MGASTLKNEPNPQRGAPATEPEPARESLLRAVVQSTRLLLSNNDHTTNVLQSLALMGAAVNCDFVCILQNHKHPQTGTRLMSKRFEWTAPGAPPSPDEPKLENLPYDPSLTRIYKRLASGAAIAAHVNDFAPAEADLLIALGIRSIAMLPILVRDTFWGHLSFSTWSEDRTWTEEEVSILKDAAAMFGGAIDRNQQEQELRSRDRLLRGMAQAVNSLLTAPNFDAGIHLALKGIGEIMNVERVYIFERRVESADENAPPLISARYVWVNPASRHHVEMTQLQNLPFDQLFPRWDVALRAGKTISGCVTDFMAPVAKRNDADLRNILLVPIRIEGRLWGFLGLDDGDLQRPWHSSDESILHTAADSLGAAAARQRAQDALRQTEERFRQAQKMEAIGRMAGGVAHDFNNLLTVIIGYSEIILGRLPRDAPIRNEIREICKAADRAHSITRQLLAFSRKQLLEPMVLNLNTIVHDLETLLHRMIGDHIKLINHLAPDLGKVRADPTQIEQVIINLALNGRDAMPAGGSLTLRTHNEVVAKRMVRGHAFVDPGHYTALSVTDTGEGIDEFVQSRLFEPFFTTKDVGKGTGLGLSMVYGILQQSNGYVMFESAKGVGTTFTIYLPQVELPEELPDRDHVPELVHGTETILLVEDEPVVRDLAHRVLMDHQYNVLTAQNGQEAYDQLCRFVGRVHLVLTDIVMPNMSGRTLADRIHASHPEVKILFMSGYAPGESSAAAPNHASFIQKPFTPAALAAKVREVLDGT